MRADTTFRCVPLFMIATQHSLVSRMRAGGSDDDWERLYAIYEKPILAFAASHSLSQAECADVLQETMVRMLRVGFSRFDPAKGRFSGFLFNIARCSVIDAIRRRAREQSRHVSIDAPRTDGSSSVALQLADSAESPADAAERQGQMALVIIALDFLVEGKRFQAKTVELFKAVALEQADPRDVAKAFRTSVGNVYEARRAVTTKLRSMLRALDQGFDLEQALAA
jgi:RNA polymerase sigma factor (sigma-70 family)